MGTFLFVNTGSGSYSLPGVEEILSGLRAAGIDPTLQNVRTPADISRCCRDICAVDNHPFIIVAAGDGTFNAVLNALPVGRADLAVLPMGTSNVLAHELGIRSCAAGVARIAGGEFRPFAVGLLATAAARYRFALMAGIGLDGAVVRDVRPAEKKFLKQGGYALSAMRTFMAWDPGTMEVVTPSGSVTCHSAVVSNTPRYGGNYLLAPASDLLSPGFTVTCIRCTTRRHWLGVIMDLFTGNAAKNPHLARISADELEIRGSKPIQIDGDFIGYAPATVTTIRDFARIIV
jgi:diacylglycerol kinase family enzyme